MTISNDLELVETRWQKMIGLLDTEQAKKGRNNKCV